MTQSQRRPKCASTMSQSSKRAGRCLPSGPSLKQGRLPHVRLLDRQRPTGSGSALSRTGSPGSLPSPRHHRCLFPGGLCCPPCGSGRVPPPRRWHSADRVRRTRQLLRAPGGPCLPLCAAVRQHRVSRCAVVTDPVLEVLPRSNGRSPQEPEWEPSPARAAKFRGDISTQLTDPCERAKPEPRSGRQLVSCRGRVQLPEDATSSGTQHSRSPPLPPATAFSPVLEFCPFPEGCCKRHFDPPKPRPPAPGFALAPPPRPLSVSETGSAVLLEATGTAHRTADLHRPRHKIETVNRGPATWRGSLWDRAVCLAKNRCSRCAADNRDV